ncbi:hypothetical protein LL14B4_06310 [Lactococcus lactis subsp. lactis]|uniref:LXG domain-containing protein n=1 Tax=Lactococcus lactis subsp. lactis TaxID=1360 RepID=A0A2Z3KEJ4_LACLL|nr:hypothetical protein [Lactococcus lactis]AWN65808.1 hypothetical protein LL14B4_06310 [Lactococcus lactis subsp. lactis]
MGLKYTKADGESLVSALTANVSSAEEIINDLQEGVNHLTSQLDNPSSGLSGKAYHAANTLFKQIVVPTLSELKSATTTIQSELSTYSFAIKAFDHYPDSVYDKEEFERLLNLKRQQKALTENHINIFMQALSTALSKTATENLIFEGKGLETVVNHYEKEIQELQDKIQILETVEGQTSSLFEHSLQDFQQALQGAKALKQGSFDSKGNFTFNKSQDLSWYQKLTGKNVDDSLISKKDDEITLKDLLEGNVSKENQATLEQLKSIAKATGMSIESVWNLFCKGAKNEWDKASHSWKQPKVNASDKIVKTIFYTNQGSETIIYNQTTNEVISISGGGYLEKLVTFNANESWEKKKEKDAQANDYFQRDEPETNEELSKRQEIEGSLKQFYDTYSGSWDSIMSGIDFWNSYESVTTNMSGQEYLDEYTKKALEQKEKELEKDWNDMSNGPVKYNN